MEKFIPTLENYQRLQGQVVLLGKSKVKVGKVCRERRLGSYERGLKWSRNEYAKLTRVSDGKISLDHGKTWHVFEKDAFKQSKGKIKLKQDLTQEFAFNSIQHLNRQYDPGFVWRP